MSSGSGYMLLVSSLVISAKWSPRKVRIVYYWTSILGVLASGSAGLMYSALTAVGLRYGYGLPFVVAAGMSFFAVLTTILVAVSDVSNGY